MSSETITEEKKPKSRRGGLFFPVLLIAVGVVFLLSNFNVLQGEPWQVILNLWPLILVAIGLDSLLSRGGLAGATVMIGLGVVLLLSNFGYIAVNVWDLVLHLWPVLLVAAGFDVIFGQRSIWLSLAGLVITLAVLFASLWFMGVRVDRMQAVNTSQISQSLQGATKARINVQQAAGQLELQALQSGEQLVEGQVPTTGAMRVTDDYALNGSAAEYTIRQTGNSFMVPSANCCNWKLGVTPDVPLEVVISLGAGQQTIVLSGLDLSRVKVDLGVGQTIITFPESGSFEAEVNCAVGQVVLVIPRDTAVRIHTSTALSAVSAPPDFRKSSGEYLSPGYQSGNPSIVVNVSNAIGNVTIQYP